MGLEQIRQEYTGKAVSEWERLQSTPITRIEYLITRHCLDRYLPGKGLVLDAGSGPGRHAIDLARQGYRVVVFDLVREMLELAQVRLAEAKIDDQAACPVEGDISRLPYANDVFDSVISLGAPLSCPYCFQWQNQPWNQDLLVKTNLPDVLARELSQFDQLTRIPFSGIL